jgi:tRNA pseudouridine38-40 synthase
VDADVVEPSNNPGAPRRTLRMVVEYVGTAFHGWQRQGAQRTVQKVLEEALASMIGERVNVRAASRTDAGVHARGQVIAFDTHNLRIPLHGFERGLNSRLPDDVAIRAVAEVEAGHHPRDFARGKHYRYVVWNDPLPTAIERDRAWWVRNRLDVDAMHDAAQRYVGTHDFEAFRAVGCPAKHAVRTMYAVDVRRVDAARIHVDVRGNAFCRNQVRIMVGTLKEVGDGRRAAASITEALRERRRALAGITAPPGGLFLEEIVFDDRMPPKPKPTDTAAAALAQRAREEGAGG